MGPFPRSFMSSEGQYLILAGEVHKAIRQLILGNAETAREILTKAIVEAEEAVFFPMDEAADSRDLHDHFDAVEKEILMKTASENKVSEKVAEPPKKKPLPPDFYKKQFERLFSQLDDVFSFMEDCLYSNAQSLLEDALIEAEEAYLPYNVDEEDLP